MNKLVLIFPGQGSQCIGMGKNIFEKNILAKQTFEEANDVLEFNLRQMCFEGSMEELTLTKNAQPAILTVSVAMFRIYSEQIGYEPSYLAGHSLGEFSALTCAGAIKFADALKIVRKRGSFMQEAVSHSTGAMAAISGVAAMEIDNICRQVSSTVNTVVISNYNTLEQTVISGYKEAVDAAIEKLKVLGARAIPLKVSAPFHSPLMETAANKLNEELKKYEYYEMKYPVLANVTALPYKNSQEIVELLTSQITAAVQWQRSMEYLKNCGINTAIELGPQNVLTNMMKKTKTDISAYAYDKEEDVKELMKILKPQKPATGNSGFRHTVVTKCLAIAICTKNNNWNEEEYQKGFVEPYKKIQAMQTDEIEKNGNQPTMAQMQAALEMLKSTFVTKKVPENEQAARFNQVFHETGTEELFKNFPVHTSSADIK